MFLGGNYFKVTWWWNILAYLLIFEGIRQYWINWFYFLILVGGLILILIDHMIFLLPSWCLYNYVTMQWQALECFAAECSLTYDQNVFKSRVNWHLSSLSLLRRAFCYAFWTNWFHWTGPTISLVLVRFSICLLVFSSVSEEFFPELTY